MQQAMLMSDRLWAVGEVGGFMKSIIQTFLEIANVCICISVAVGSKFVVAFSVSEWSFAHSRIYLGLKIRCSEKKTMKNESKINPKSIKNGSKIHSKSLEIKVWMHRGGILKTSWGVLGSLGSILGLGSAFGATWLAPYRVLASNLEPSWRRLGPVLGRLWGHLWPPRSVWEASWA